MKIKKFLSIFLCILIAVGCVPFAVQNVKAETTPKKITEYEVGDTFEFGWYPQSEVKDDTTLAALNEKAKVTATSAETIKASTAAWTSYGYYSGTGIWDDGLMTAKDYMRYKDIIYNGNKYRGVVFDTYRPYETGWESSSDMDKDTTYQGENGYSTGTVYWFKYEPITWRVLDPAKGMVMSETLLDSQAFNNYIIKENYQYYGEPDENGIKYYANNYAESSIRKWLNDDFINTAFSSSQQNIISETAVETEKFNEESTSTTNDKIYLLSYSDAFDESYGFSSSADENETRIAQGSDYAKSQGLWVDSSGGYAYWHLRSAGAYSCDTCIVFNDGYVDVGAGFGTDDTSNGVRPAFNFNPASAIVQQPVTSIDYFQTGDTFEYGWYPQSEVEDDTTLAALNAQAEVATKGTAAWTSYGYYSGTGTYDDGEMTAKDYMRYKDVIYNGNKYRGVVFDTYRPYETGWESSSDMNKNTTYQDENGYSTETVYWFKYEPITWRVLNPETGMVMSETLLDSQAFNNYIIMENGHYYGEPDETGNMYYANNYAESSIRKWLNDDFINTAFSGSQQNIIATTTLDNSAYSTSYSEYNSEPTYDKIYLLSYSDALNESYGFKNEAARIAQGSDYAKSQGLGVSISGNSFWHLRSAGAYSDGTCIVFDGGGVDSYYGTDDTSNGVRPAFNFNPASAIVQQPVVKEKITDYGVGDTFEFGWYPQSEVEDDTTLAALNAQAEVAAKGTAAWTSYGYYSGTGTYDDGEMTAKDYMRYKDVIYNGNKYRGVVFDTYRPYFTGWESYSDMNKNTTYQDENGYSTGTVYWFKYEPITWRVLDPAKGMVMSETLLDSQAFNNYIIIENGYYYGEPDENGIKYYVNNYEHSSIRKWLNDDFINTAFSGSQQGIMTAQNLDGSTTISDKIYLLSKTEVENSDYGFKNDAARKAQGSDYAKSQGLFVYNGSSEWHLRSAGNLFKCRCGVSIFGNIDSYSGTNDTSDGVRPAFNFIPASGISQCDVTEVGIAKYTVETYKMKTDGTYDKTTASLKGGVGTTAKAEYTVPTGFTLGADSVTEGKILSDGSLVLKVYLNRNKYTITAVADGNSTPYEFYYEQTVSGIPDPSKAGYKFTGWSDEIPATMPANSVTVTAQFTENSNYTVKFNTDGGNEIADKTGVKWTDKVLDGVTAPTKAGYAFNGWYVGDTEVNNNTKYSDIVANDTVMSVELTATWTENSNYTVKFNTDGGNEIADKTGVKWTDKVLDGIAAPTKAGYVFNGWYVGDTEVNNNTKYADIVANDTVMSVELKAKWLDIEKPVITGLEAGKSYCDHVSFYAVDSNGVASVTVNGTELVPDSDGKYTVTAEYGEATIVVTDKAGNTESITVTVNEHNYYIGECTECGSEDPNASFFIRLIRYIINWFRSFMKML